MVSVYKENIFFERAHVGDSFRPTAIAFIIVCCGEIVIELNEIESIYGKGSIALIFKENVYKLKSFTDDLQVYVISIDREKVLQKINFNFNRYDVYRIANSEKINVLLHFNSAEFQNIKNIAEQILFYSDQKRNILFQEKIITSLFSSFLYIVTGKLLKTSDRLSQKNSRKEDITMQFMELISLNYKKEKELKFYSDQLLVSVKYLSNCVREVTKVPPTKFISDMVMNEAKTLLLNSKKAINMISEELGFSDQYSFGKFFKKHSGYSPRNFRLQNNLVDTF